jgi:hypothetical protein
MYHKSRKPKEFLKLLMHAERLVKKEEKTKWGAKEKKRFQYNLLFLIVRRKHLCCL